MSVEQAEQLANTIILTLPLDPFAHPNSGHLLIGESTDLQKALQQAKGVLGKHQALEGLVYVEDSNFPATKLLCGDCQKRRQRINLNDF